MALKSEKFEMASSSSHPWKLMSGINSWQTLLNCLVRFSCLHLTSARIQVARSSASVNSKSHLLRFDWLFQTFWHWWALLSCCTEPERAKLEFLRANRLGQWSYIGYPVRTCTYYNLFFIYIRNGPAHIVQRPTGKTPGAPDGQSATVYIYIYIYIYIN